MKKFLVLLFLVMFAGAAWQYRQVVIKQEVQADFPACKLHGKKECENHHECDWKEAYNTCAPAKEKRFPPPSRSPKPSPSVSPSPSPSPSPSVSPSPNPSVSPSPSPLPSPSPSPSVSPSPTPTPEPGNASFVIRKFKDDDKDGSWDNNETATGQTWQFQYRLNSDDWHNYQTDPSSGWGETITVGVDTKIEVKELTVDGWVNTTGLTQIKILDESKVYYFDFGNFQSPSATNVPAPSQTPQAGAGHSYWPWIGALAIGIGLQVAALLL